MMQVQTCSRGLKQTKIFGRGKTLVLARTNVLYTLVFGESYAVLKFDICLMVIEIVGNTTCCNAFYVLQDDGRWVHEHASQSGGFPDGCQGRLSIPGHAIEAGWFLLQEALTKSVSSIL